ncbi:MAG: hypothetical protein RI894_444 [Bacteroidota bacterium]|jgi:hypothetical protein
MQTEINIRTTNMTIYDIHKLIVSERLLLEADVPHHNQWTAQQKTLFIESLMMGIPIPALY